jgi:hypothetical protein
MWTYSSNGGLVDTFSPIVRWYGYGSPLPGLPLYVDTDCKGTTYLDGASISGANRDNTTFEGQDGSLWGFAGPVSEIRPAITFRMQYRNGGNYGALTCQPWTNTSGNLRPVMLLTAPVTVGPLTLTTP